jgi:hypothetical protein
MDELYRTTLMGDLDIDVDEHPEDHPDNNSSPGE